MMNRLTMEELKHLTEENGEVEREAVFIERLVGGVLTERDLDPVRVRLCSFLKMVHAMLKRCLSSEDNLAGSAAVWVIREDHRWVAQLLSDAESLLPLGTTDDGMEVLGESVRTLIQALREHIVREEKYLYETVAGRELAAPLSPAPRAPLP